MGLFSQFKKLRKAAPEEQDDFQKMMEEEQVGFKDKLAMVISALLVIVLPCLVILVVISALALLVFGGFG